MFAIITLTRILGLSFVSGINLYATILAVGLCIRYNWVSGLPPELHILAHPAVLVVAAAMYGLEFFADKIPLVSVFWDGLHTFIRPIGGALLALGGAANLDPALQVVAFMVGGSIALGTHSTKMGFRILAHKYPEPVAHSAISVIEDVGVVGLLTLAYTHPVVALCLILCLIVCMIWLAPLLFRTIACVLSGVAGLMVFWRRRAIQPPAWLAAKIEPLDDAHAPQFYPCFARSVKGVPKLKKGYFFVRGEQAFFAYHGLFKSKLLSVGGKNFAGTDLRRGLIFDLLSVSDLAGADNTIYLTKPHSRQWSTSNDESRCAGTDA